MAERVPRTPTNAADGTQVFNRRENQVHPSTESEDEVKYHNTVPSVSGFYLFEGMEGIDCAEGGDGDLEYYLPHEVRWTLGPLPATSDEAISLACEVAFARMWLAYWQAIMATRKENSLAFADLSTRFSGNERSITLYRDMQRVTGELTVEKTAAT